MACARVSCHHPIGMGPYPGYILFLIIPLSSLQCCCCFCCCCCCCCRACFYCCYFFCCCCRYHHRYRRCHHHCLLFCPDERHTWHAQFTDYFIVQDRGEDCDDLLFYVKSDAGANGTAQRKRANQKPAEDNPVDVSTWLKRGAAYSLA